MPTVSVPPYNRAAMWALPAIGIGLTVAAWWQGMRAGLLVPVVLTAILAAVAASVARRRIRWDDDGIELRGLSVRRLRWADIEAVDETYMQGHHGLRLRVRGRRIHFGLSMFRPADAAKVRAAVRAATG